MSAVTRGLRTATKQLRIQPRGLRVASPLVARSGSASIGAARSATPASYSAFSTSTVRSSGAPVMPSQAREYDPEIKDIADYVANKPIDSELAVSVPRTECRRVGRWELPREPLKLCYPATIP